MPQMPKITIQLIHIQGPFKGQIQDYATFPVEIGRHSSCHVRFDKDMTTISRRHARIERQGNRFRIIDASTNGTYVNGKRIADVYLRDGDVITFAENGPKVSFLTKIENGTVSVPSVPTARSSSPLPPVGENTGVSRPLPPNAGDAGMTVGPAGDVPVISSDAPLVLQYGPTLQSYDTLPITIGTDPGCDFVIASSVLAGRHVQLFFSAGDYYAKDLTGRNMVTINGRPVGSHAVLAQGAELALSENGPKFRFLGGGRLAEVQEATPEPLAKTDADPNLQGVPGGVPKSGSLFKKIFK